MMKVKVCWDSEQGVKFGNFKKYTRSTEFRKLMTGDARNAEIFPVVAEL